MSTVNSWRLKSKVFVSELVGGGEEEFHKKLLLMSECSSDAFREAIKNRQRFDIPWPCAIESVDPIDSLDHFFRIMLIQPKYDAKRVKAKVLMEAERLREQEGILPDPKTLAKEARLQDYDDQVPRISESVWGVWNRYAIHSSSNLKVIANHFTTALDWPLLLSAPTIVYRDDVTAKDIWPGTCIERMNLAGVDFVKIVVHVMVGSIEAFSATLHFDETKYNKFSIASTSILSPKTVFKLWKAAVEIILQNNSCVSFEMKASSLE